MYSSIFPLHRAISFSQPRCLDSVFSVARCERCDIEGREPDMGSDTVLSGCSAVSFGVQVLLTGMVKNAIRETGFQRVDRGDKDFQASHKRIEDPTRKDKNEDEDESEGEGEDKDKNKKK